MKNKVHKKEPQEYAAEYRFPGSKAVNYVVAPPPMTEEEIEKVLQNYDRAFWEAWNTLTPEQQLKINAERSHSAG